MKRKAFSLSATLMRYVLIIVIVLAVAGIGTVFYYAQRLLGAKALEADHAKIDAELAQEEISRLQQLKKTLQDNQPQIAKTALIVAQSQQYEFQTQVVNDITTYAQQSGVEILGFDFGVKPGAPAKKVPGSKVNQQKTIVTVQLNNNIPYASFLKFIKSIEQNVTKMQLTGMVLQPTTADATLITAPTVEIEVYLR